MKKLIKFILFSQYHFKLPNEKNILLYDEITSDHLKFFFNEFDYNILNTRNYIIYPKILLKSFLKYGLRWNIYKYLLEVINFLNPKVIFTGNDNDTFFWKINKLSDKKVMTVFIQNGFRSYSNDIFGIIDKDKKYNKINHKVDYFFVFSESIKKKYKEYLEGEAIVAGSIKNNMIKINKKENKRDILFISEFVASNKNYDYKTSKESYWYTENFILPIIKEFAQKNNLNLKILGKLNKNANSKQQERIFFEKIIGHEGWEYIESSQKYESYRKIDNSKFVVFISSTLGYEAISRGKPTAAFCSRNFRNNLINDFTFAWPSKLPKQGSFWTNDCNKNEVIKILNYCNTIDEKKWEEEISHLKKEFMIYDKGNSILYDFLKANNIPYIKSN